MSQMVRIYWRVFRLHHRKYSLRVVGWFLLVYCFEYRFTFRYLS